MCNFLNFFLYHKNVGLYSRPMSNSGAWPVWLADASHGRKKPKVWTFSSILLQLCYFILSTEESLLELKGVPKCRSFGPILDQNDQNLSVFKQVLYEIPGKTSFTKIGECLAVLIKSISKNKSLEEYGTLSQRITL